MRWHFLETSPAAGPWNMALDEALLGRAAETGEAVFRVYGWSAPTLSLGRNQRARGCYDLGAARRLGVAFVRRPTGGRALLHHREITYSATLPAGVSEARATYQFINRLLISALAKLGVRAQLASSPVAMPPGLRPCFDLPAAGEIEWGGRKLVGSAQWRHAGGLLQHGSILIHNDQNLIAELLQRGAPPGANVPATLAAALGGEPDPGAVAACLIAALTEAAGARPSTLVPDDALNAAARRFESVYAGDSWTWRR